MLRHDSQSSRRLLYSGTAKTWVKAFLENQKCSCWFCSCFFQNLSPEGQLNHETDAFVYTSDPEDIEIEIVYTSDPENIKIEIVYTSDPENVKIEIVCPSDPEIQETYWGNNSRNLLGQQFKNFIGATFQDIYWGINSRIHKIWSLVYF